MFMSVCVCAYSFGAVEDSWLARWPWRARKALRKADKDNNHKWKEEREYLVHASFADCQPVSVFSLCD